MVASQRSATAFSFDGFSEDASDIANAFLSRTGAALMSGDFDSFAECMALPHRLETFEGLNVLKSRKDIESVFIGVRRHLVRKSVTEMIRNCLSAQFHGTDTIKFTHETRFVNGQRLVQESFPCLSTVARVEGRWLLTSTSYAIVNAPQHVDALMGRLGQSPASQTQA